MSDLEGVQVHCGHVLDEIRKVPDASIDMVFTSPPFYLARSYGTDPAVWGGARNCPHPTWEEHVTKCGNGSGGGVNNPGSKDRRSVLNHARTVRSETCTMCGAWRGEHGHEPTVQKWVEHERELAAEIRRVLKPWGVYAIEGRDTYSCQPNGRDESEHAGDDRTHRNKPRVRPSLPHGSLHMQFERLMIALQDDGWRLRSATVVQNPNPKAESVHGWRHSRMCEITGAPMVLRRGSWRPTTAHSMLYVLAGKGAYYADEYAVRDYSCSAHGHNAWSVLKVPRSHGDGTKHTARLPFGLARWVVSAFAPAQGVCAECGMPWVRCIQIGANDLDSQKLCGGGPDGQYRGKARVERGGDGSEDPSEVKRRILEGIRVVETVGWAPSCACKAGARVRAKVLDPYAGSGTVLSAARQLGADAVGIELHPGYAEEAMRNLGATVRGEW